MSPALDHNKTLLHLTSCFYGDVLVVHTARLALEVLYTNSLDMILGDV